MCLTQEDLSIYFHAKELPTCMILTADNRLKKEAKRQGFEVQGILWVFEKLVETKILSSEIATLKLDILMQLNAGITENDCNEIKKKMDNTLTKHNLNVSICHKIIFGIFIET